eukprot:1454679-Amphidinium_carterae.1
MGHLGGASVFLFFRLVRGRSSFKRHPAVLAKNSAMMSTPDFCVGQCASLIEEQGGPSIAPTSNTGPIAGS